MQLPLSREYLRGHCRVIYLPHFNIVTWGNRSPRRGTDGEHLSSGTFKTHIYQFCHFIWAWFLTPQNNSNIRDDHHNKYHNNKSLEYYENYQSVTQTGSEQMLLEQRCHWTCLTQSCHKPSVVGEVKVLSLKLRGEAQ